MQPTVCSRMFWETMNMPFKDLQDLLDLQDNLDKPSGLVPVRMWWMWWTIWNVNEFQHDDDRLCLCPCLCHSYSSSPTMYLWMWSQSFVCIPQLSCVFSSWCAAWHCEGVQWSGLPRASRTTRPPWSPSLQPKWSAWKCHRTNGLSQKWVYCASTAKQTVWGTGLMHNLLFYSAKSAA